MHTESRPEGLPSCTIGFKEIDDSAQMIHCLEEDTIAKNR
jgi:hypothetical protein